MCEAPTLCVCSCALGGWGWMGEYYGERSPTLRTARETRIPRPEGREGERAALGWVRCCCQGAEHGPCNTAATPCTVGNRGNRPPSSTQQRRRMAACSGLPKARPVRTPAQPPRTGSGEWRVLREPLRHEPLPLLLGRNVDVGPQRVGEVLEHPAQAALQEAGQLPLPCNRQGQGGAARTP